MCLFSAPSLCACSAPHSLMHASSFTKPTHPTPASPLQQQITEGGQSPPPPPPFEEPLPGLSPAPAPPAISPAPGPIGTVPDNGPIMGPNDGGLVTGAPEGQPAPGPGAGPAGLSPSDPLLPPLLSPSPDLISGAPPLPGGLAPALAPAGEPPIETGFYGPPPPRRPVVPVESPSPEQQPGAPSPEGGEGPAPAPESSIPGGIEDITDYPPEEPLPLESPPLPDVPALPGQPRASPPPPRAQQASPPPPEGGAAGSTSPQPPQGATGTGQRPTIGRRLASLASMVVGLVRPARRLQQDLLTGGGTMSDPLLAAAAGGNLISGALLRGGAVLGLLCCMLWHGSPFGGLHCRRVLRTVFNIIAAHPIHTPLCYWAPALLCRMLTCCCCSHGGPAPAPSVLQLLACQLLKCSFFPNCRRACGPLAGGRPLVRGARRPASLPAGALFTRFLFLTSEVPPCCSGSGMCSTKIGSGLPCARQACQPVRYLPTLPCNMPLTLPRHIPPHLPTGPHHAQPGHWCEQPEGCRQRPARAADQRHK